MTLLPEFDFSFENTKNVLLGHRKTVITTATSGCKVNARILVSSPDPTHYARKGLVTFEGFLGCAHPHVLIQQARDLHVRIHIDIHRECMQGTFVYVCVASLFSVLLINCQRSQISRSDQGRSDNGVYACANAYL